MVVPIAPAVSRRSGQMRRSLVFIYDRVDPLKRLEPRRLFFCTGPGYDNTPFVRYSQTNMEEFSRGVNLAACYMLVGDEASVDACHCHSPSSYSNTFQDLSDSSLADGIIFTFIAAPHICFSRWPLVDSKHQRWHGITTRTRSIRLQFSSSDIDLKLCDCFFFLSAASPASKANFSPIAF